MSEGTGRLLCGQALGAWPCGHYGKGRVQQPHRASHSRRAALPQQAQHPSSFHVIDSKAPAQRHGGTGGQPSSRRRAMQRADSAMMITFHSFDWMVHGLGLLGPDHRKYSHLPACCADGSATCAFVPPPPPAPLPLAQAGPCLGTGAGIDPLFLGFWGTVVVVALNVRLGVREVVVETTRGSFMSVIVPSVHNTIPPHIAPRCCLFGCDSQPKQPLPFPDGAAPAVHASSVGVLPDEEAQVSSPALGSAGGTASWPRDQL